MIVDFQHHYTPQELFDAKGGGDTLSARLDENGNPSYLLNPLLCDLDAHIRMMDGAGIDIAVLSCGEGFDNPDPDACRFINDKMKQAEEEYQILFTLDPEEAEAFRQKLDAARTTESSARR